MNCLLLAATLCLFVVFATAQTGCNNNYHRCTSQVYTDVRESEELDEICRAARTYRDCLGSSCPVADPIKTVMKQLGCGSGSERVVISVSSLLMTLVFTKIFM